MARIEEMTIGLDMKNKEDLELYYKAINGDGYIIYKGEKYAVKSISIESADLNRAEVIVLASNV